MCVCVYSLNIYIVYIRPFLSRRHNYVTALAKGKPKGELVAVHSNQHRFSNMSLKYNLVVMLGDRIDIVQASNLKLYRIAAATARQKRMTVVKMR